MDLKNRKILMIGGDERYTEVIKKLSRSDADVVLAGFDQLDVPHGNIRKQDLHQVDFHTIDIVLLPVSGTDENGNIGMASYSNQKLRLTEEMLAQLPDTCKIYTGVTSDFLNRAAGNKEVIPLFAREDVAIYNSIPTAEGTLALAMQETNFTIHGAFVMVIGFGRVGITTARLFAAVGANVKVAVRKSSAAARVREMTMQPVYMHHLQNELKDCDIIINTAPASVLDKDCLQHVPKHSIIIDLASEPGGVDFSAARESGIHAIHALGLPGKVAPKTAGAIIADTFITLLEEAKY